MGQSKLKGVVEPKLFKLDIGCGKNKKGPEWFGLDVIKFPGVDKVWDVRKTPWPFKSDSVDEVHSSHFVEHLTGTERISFFNELYRVMKVEAPAQIITPDWSTDRAYGDPTHQWPPMSSWYPFYLGEWWRKDNAPHVGYTCNFFFQNGISFDHSIMNRNDEYKQFATHYYKNAVGDLYANLVKKPPGWKPTP